MPALELFTVEISLKKKASKCEQKCFKSDSADFDALHYLIELKFVCILNQTSEAFTCIRETVASFFINEVK